MRSPRKKGLGDSAGSLGSAGALHFFLRLRSQACLGDLCASKTSMNPTEPLSSTQHGSSGICGSLGNRTNQMIQVFHVGCWVAAIALEAIALAGVLALVFAFAFALAAVARCTARAAAPATAPFTVASRRWVTTCHGCECICSALEQGARCSVVPWRERASLHQSLDSSEVRANVAKPVFFTRRLPVAADAAGGHGRMDWALKGSGWPDCDVVHNRIAASVAGPASTPSSP